MIGRTLAHYEVQDALGRGGMGEVFRARDTKLGRDVAIKVLPEAVAADPERRARFEREARTLAALNHPNVAQIYGLEEADDVRFLVMEYVEGLDLQKRLENDGPLDPDEATALAVQMAAGLEAAHDQGIVHRDLKPANVMVTSEGQVKVLDFGLARAFAGESTEEDPSLSPTITAAMTQAGTVLGTAAYMSPEQARGKTVDRRADIWAFGVILTEMLTGRSLFAGETVSDTLAGVLKQPIDFDTLPKGTPAPLRYVLERCLDRNPSRRLRDIGEARLVLSGEATSLSIPAAQGDSLDSSSVQTREIVAWALAVIGLASAAVLLLRGPDATTTLDGGKSIRATIELPAELQISSDSSSGIAISPDGSTIVVSAENRAGVASEALYRRPIDGVTFERIENTENAEDPSFSPDGQHLTYVVNSFKQFRIPLEGGAPTDLGRSDAFGTSWTDDDSLVYCQSYAGGIQIRSAEGGASRKVTTPEHDEGVLGHWHPELIPGTPWILYTAYHSPGDSSKAVAVNRENGETRLVVEGARFARWSDSGHVLFVRQNQLLALAVDRETMRPRGNAATILPDMYMDATDGFSQFAISRDGTFLYMPLDEASYRGQVVIIRHDGTVEPLSDDARAFLTPRIAPDGRSLAVTSGARDRDIWLLDLTRRAWTRLTFDATSEFGPVWSPDGAWIYYARESPAFNVYRLRPFRSASPERILASPLDHMPLEVFDDGSFLAIKGTVSTSHDIVHVDLEGTTTNVRAGAYLDTEGRLSPDGKWLAYTTNEGGRLDVYVQSHPSGDTRIPISINGGQEPCWAPDGQALYFREEDTLLRVELQVVDGRLSVGQPETLWTHPFEQNWYTANYDVLPDDSGIIAIVPQTETGRRRFTLITNFFAELERRAPARD